MLWIQNISIYVAGYVTFQISASFSKEKKCDSAHPVSSVFTTKYEDCKPMRIDRNKQILNTAAHKYRPLQQENAKYYQKQILSKDVDFVHVWLNNIYCIMCNVQIVVAA